MAKVLANLLIEGVLDIKGEYTFPETAGVLGEVLTMDAGGTITWQPGGGGSQDLASVLSIDNETGGTDIDVNNGDEIIFGGATGGVKAYRDVDPLLPILYLEASKGIEITGADSLLWIKGSPELVSNTPSGHTITFHIDGFNANPFITAVNGTSGFLGTLHLGEGLTSNRSWYLPDEGGTFLIGPQFNTLVANPTALEEGYVLTWDDATGEYGLLPSPADVNLGTHDLELDGAREVNQMGEYLKFYDGYFIVGVDAASPLFTVETDTEDIVFGYGGNEYHLPTTRGNDGEVLQTDAVGNVTWQAPSGGEAIEEDFIPKGNGIGIEKSKWKIDGKDLIPTEEPSNIGSPGSPELRIDAVYMDSTIDFLDNLKFEKEGESRVSIDMDSTLRIHSPSISLEDSAFLIDNAEASIFEMKADGSFINYIKIGDEITKAIDFEATILQEYRIHVDTIIDSGTLTLGLTPNDYTFPTEDGEIDQILKTDGEGTLTWYSPTTEGITGSGLPGEVTKWTEEGQVGGIESGLPGDVLSLNEDGEASWAPGLQGEPGEPGEDGTDGIDGEPGEQGEPGEDGTDGIDGINGEPGEQGEPGMPGDPGEQGEPGEQGPPGDDGSSSPRSQTRIMGEGVLGIVSAPVASNTILYLTTSGGSFPSEKWWDITTEPQDNEGSGSESQIAAQIAPGNEEEGYPGAVGYGGGFFPTNDSAGLVTDLPITLPIGDEVIYFNTYDQYDDGWDGTNFELRTLPGGEGDIVASGIDPNDGFEDPGGTWLDGETGTKWESSTEFIVPGGEEPEEDSVLLTVLNLNSDEIDRPLRITFVAQSETHEVKIEGLTFANESDNAISCYLEIMLAIENAPDENLYGNPGQSYFETIELGAGLITNLTPINFLISELEVGLEYEYFLKARVSEATEVFVKAENIFGHKLIKMTEVGVNLTEI